MVNHQADAGSSDIDNNSEESIGDRLRRIRKDRDKTLEVIAGLAGITKGYLSLLERGERVLDSIKLINRLAEALEIAPEDQLRLSRRIYPRSPTPIRLSALTPLQVGRYWLTSSIHCPSGVTVNRQRSASGLPWSTHQEWAAATSSHSLRGPYWRTVYGAPASWS